MLYNPFWTKPSLAGFIAWLKKQDPFKQYSYIPADACPINEYLKTIGTTYFKLYSSGEDILWEWNMNITHSNLGEQTLGAALKRAEAYAAKQAA